MVSVQQARTLSYAPHFTGALSIFGSLSIIISLNRSENSQNEVRKRLMTGLSLCDIIGSTGFFLSTWPINSEDRDETYVLGNATSCTFQGFLVQWSATVPLYNVMLAIYYLLAVKHRMRDNEMRKIEAFMHTVPILFGIITTSICLALDLFNDASLWCWIAPNGDGSPSIWAACRWGLYYGPLWASYVAVTAMMIALYKFVATQDKRIHRFRSSSVSLGRSVSSSNLNSIQRNESSNSRKLANQSMLYVGVFYIVWIIPTINRIYDQFKLEKPFALPLLTAIVTPSQGFLNYLVYLRPKVLEYLRQKQKRKSSSTAKIDGEAIEIVIDEEDINMYSPRAHRIAVESSIEVVDETEYEESSIEVVHS